MNTERIKKLAEQAGIEEWWDSGNECREVLQEHLEKLAELIAAEEREACAKVCDDELKQWGIFDSDVGDVSKAIRARGNE